MGEKVGSRGQRLLTLIGGATAPGGTAFQIGVTALATIARGYRLHISMLSTKPSASTSRNWNPDTDCGVPATISE